MTPSYGLKCVPVPTNDVEALKASPASARVGAPKIMAAARHKAKIDRVCLRGSSMSASCHPRDLILVSKTGSWQVPINQGSWGHQGFGNLSYPGGLIKHVPVRERR